MNAIAYKFHGFTVRLRDLMVFVLLAGILMGYFINRYNRLARHLADAQATNDCINEYKLLVSNLHSLKFAGRCEESERRKNIIKYLLNKCSMQDREDKNLPSDFGGRHRYQADALEKINERVASNHTKILDEAAIFDLDSYINSFFCGTSARTGELAKIINDH